MHFVQPLSVGVAAAAHSTFQSFQQLEDDRLHEVSSQSASPEPTVVQGPSKTHPLSTFND